MSVRPWATLAMLALLILAACGPSPQAPLTSGSARSSTTSAAALSGEGDPLQTILASLTTTQKASQVLLMGFPGRDIDPSLAAMLAEAAPPGGVILFDRNLGPPDETRTLTSALQQAARRSSPGIPLLVAVDQEGGPVARLRQGVPLLPAARRVAATQTPPEAEASAYRQGRALLDLGVNMNLAPVLDVVGDPESFLHARSYGSSAEVVAGFGSAVIQGYATAGVITSAKHFPGHGSASGDTHDRLVRSVLPRESLREHLLPFERAVAAGVPTIMVSHVVVDAWDAERPASLSPVIADVLLRKELGFKGVAVSDDLEMVGGLGEQSIGQAAVRALQAGLDLLIVSAHQQSPLEARDAIVQAARRGELSSGRLDEAVLRVLRLKAEFGLLPG